MPTCENCQNKWSWKQTIKLTTTLNPSIHCPCCGEKQYQTQKSKTKSTLLTFMILLPLLLNIFFEIPGAILLSSIPVLFIIAVLLYPFLVEVSNREEYINLIGDKK